MSKLPEGTLEAYADAYRAARRGANHTEAHTAGLMAVLASRSQDQDLRTALAWYGEQARLARLVHSEGDLGRHALAEDGGKRAAAILSTLTPAQAPDKAAEREGAAQRAYEAFYASTGARAWTEIGEEYRQSWRAVADAIAPQPNASRGVGAEAIYGLIDEGHGNFRYRIKWADKVAESVGPTLDEARRNCEKWARGFGWDATPTPPTPDSPGPAGAGQSAQQLAEEIASKAWGSVEYGARLTSLRHAVVTEIVAALTPSAPIAAAVRDDGALLKDICSAVCRVEGWDPDTLMSEYDDVAHGERPTDPYWTRYAEAVSAVLASLPAPAGDVPTSGKCGYSECAALGRTVCEDCRGLSATGDVPGEAQTQVGGR